MDITTRTRHLIQHLPDQRTRLLIEWTPPFHGNVRPVAIRHCFDEEGSLDRVIGATLGFDLIHPCVLFLLVQEGDLVSVGEKTIGGRSASWIHYQVGPDFALKRINIGGRTLTAAEIRAWLPPAVTSYHQPPGCDESLREFLADPKSSGVARPHPGTPKTEMADEAFVEVLSPCPVRSLARGDRQDLETRARRGAEVLFRTPDKGPDQAVHTPRPQNRSRPCLRSHVAGPT